MAEKQPPRKLVGKKYLANLFDLTERWIDQLMAEGVLVPEKLENGAVRFDLYPAITMYVKYLRLKAAGREEKNVDKVTAEQEKARADADWKRAKAKVAELQLAELEGRMHRSDDVEAVLTDLVYTVRSMLLALPGRLAMDVMQATSANEASAIIRGECVHILDELTEYKYDPEVFRKRVRERLGWGEAIDDVEEEE